ncbi:MAG: hypothetical protein GC131_06425 [Alphaproteobacteria bacterium]|nr:hypothetical protein [Alphaproteobacteria bacterium]
MIIEPKASRDLARYKISRSFAVGAFLNNGTVHRSLVYVPVSIAAGMRTGNPMAIPATLVFLVGTDALGGAVLRGARLLFGRPHNPTNG